MTLPGFPDAAPLPGLIGGLLIGLAAALMLLGAGRIAGVSGIAARAFGLADSSLPRAGAWAFVIGLPLGAFLGMSQTAAPTPDFASPVLLVIAGLIVGIGTRIGSGCTSGHGVCGMSRGVRHSIIATCVFMAAAMVTVWVMKMIFAGGAQ